MRKNSAPIRKRLIDALVRNAETMIQTGLSMTTRTCGAPTCACHEDASRRHGPHTYLTFRSEEQTSKSLYVPAEHVGEAMAAKRAWDEFWEAASALAVLNREQMKQDWLAARKAREKK